MQKDIHYYGKLIQEKRKKTPWREFVKELGSWEIFNIYKRSDNIISKYHSDERIGGISENFWENAEENQRETTKGEEFLKEFAEFSRTTQQQALARFGNNENSEFSESIFGAKNAYLSFQVGLNAENTIYSAFIYSNTRNVFSSIFVTNNCDNIYSSGAIENSHNIFYSKYITGSSNIWFSVNLIGCEECIYCNEIQNKKFCINNIEYSREEYSQKKTEILKRNNLFESIYKKLTKMKGVNKASKNVAGDYIVESENIENGMWISHFLNGRNILIGNGGDCSVDCYDGLDIGVNGKNMYAAVAAGNGEHLYCVNLCGRGSSHIYYSISIENSHHCLGCIGLKNKSYCILNKQYAKEEWEEKVCEIFASMEADGTLGSFFPASMNPFYFNDTLAYLIDDTFTKEEVEADGYLWRDEPIRADIPEGMRVVKNTELDQFQGFRRLPVKGGADEGGGGFDAQSQNPPGSPLDRGVEQWYIDPEVLNVVISDEKGNYYRIVKMEYDFLMKHGLPLPTMHWLDRMKMGFR